MIEAITGSLKGEICNRNGCDGILQVHFKEYDCCSCHVKSPCDYCIDTDCFCPECDWSNRDNN